MREKESLSEINADLRAKVKMLEIENKDLKMELERLRENIKLLSRFAKNI